MPEFTLPAYTDGDVTPAEHAAFDAARLAYYERFVRPTLEACFEQHPWIASAAICVGQYWDDEAVDAVHAAVVFSMLDRPDVDAAFGGDHDVNLPEGGRSQVSSHWELLMERADGSTRWSFGDDVDGRDDRWWWHDNTLAISLFAAFCPGGGDQCASMADNYAPWAVVRRGTGGRLTLEVVGTMLRPWLDGVRPAYEDDDDVEGEPLTVFLASLFGASTEEPEERP